MNNKTVDQIREDVNEYLTSIGPGELPSETHIEEFADEFVTAHKREIAQLKACRDGNDDLSDGFKDAKEPFGRMIRSHRVSVYVLTNYNTTMEWNLHRIYTLRDLGYDPYVMVYDKQHAPKEIRRLQRWCNSKFIFKKTPKFEDYK